MAKKRASVKHPARIRIENVRIIERPLTINSPSIPASVNLSRQQDGAFREETFGGRKSEEEEE